MMNRKQQEDLNEEEFGFARELSPQIELDAEEDAALESGTDEDESYRPSPKVYHFLIIIVLQSTFWAIFLIICSRGVLPIFVQQRTNASEIRIVYNETCLKIAMGPVVHGML